AATGQRSTCSGRWRRRWESAWRSWCRRRSSLGGPPGGRLLSSRARRRPRGGAQRCRPSSVRVRQLGPHRCYNTRQPEPAYAADSLMLCRQPLTSVCNCGMVNFVRCGALQCHVRTVGVVPTNGTLHVEMEQPTQQRHRGHGTRAFLQRADEAFHNRNTAALADGAETLADSVAATPLLQAVTTELLAPVGNQMPRRCTDAGNDLAEKPSDLLRSWLAQEEPEAQA